MIFYNSNIPKWFGFEGITIFIFIFINYSEQDCPKWLVNHEKLHVEQQIKWLFIPFYIVYAWDYVLGRLSGLTHWGAYRNIRFEKEAYEKYGSNR
jgi:hypothetical protein